MRAILNEVYFGKARQIVGELRSVESTTEIKSRDELGNFFLFFLIIKYS